MDVWSQVFSFQDYGALVQLVQTSIWAGAVLGIVGGLIGPFVVARNMPFAVHGISELSFAGASASLLLGVNVVTGSLVGSVIAALTTSIAILIVARVVQGLAGAVFPLAFGIIRDEFPPERVAGDERKADLVIAHAEKRTQRHARQLDELAHAATHAHGIRPARIRQRHRAPLEVEDRVAERAVILLELPLVQDRVDRHQHFRWR